MEYYMLNKNTPKYAAWSCRKCFSSFTNKFHSEFFINGFHFVKVAFFSASQVVLVVKSPPTNAGDIRDSGSIPGLGRSPGGGHGNPLQYSCLGNPMDRGAWQATAHRVAESDTTEET